MVVAVRVYLRDIADQVSLVIVAFLVSLAFDVWVSSGSATGESYVAAAVVDLCSFFTTSVQLNPAAVSFTGVVTVCFGLVGSGPLEQTLAKRPCCLHIQQ